MNILIELGHPKHYYQYKELLSSLRISGYKTLVIARNKDVLLKVLDEEKVSYLVFGKYGKSMFGKFLVLPDLFFQYFKILKKNRIDLIISKASPYASIMGWINGIKRISTPDSEVVLLTRKIVAPLSSLIITPENYGLNFGPKHKRFKGFFEDCYLHPSVFFPDDEVVGDLGINTKEKYFVLRFVGWKANHDINNFGFKESEKVELVTLLKDYGTVYISSEESLPDDLMPYHLRIPASKIHHVLHFASLYIGDSQTMATESAILGTPSIRYNSFVGPKDMTNFIILEEKYKLLYNYRVFDEVKKKAVAILQDNNQKQNWSKKRDFYYNEIGNPNRSIVNVVNDFISIIN